MAQQDIGEDPVKELLKRFFVTFLLGVVIYRLGVFIPIPGVNAEALNQLVTAGMGGNDPLRAMLAYANMFNGGAIAQASIFGLGITPYISASIIIQLMAFSIPSLKALQKEGETGRRKLNQYTRYVTLVIALVQSVIAAIALSRYSAGGVVLLTPDAMANPLLWTVEACLVITTGSMLILWIADQITRFGIGNGVSIVIMISILAYLPQAFAGHATELAELLGLIAVCLVIIAAIVVVVQAVRRVHLEQQRRVQGNRVYGGAQTTLPLKLNHANVIPVIFAQPVVVLLVMLASTPWLAHLGLDQFMAYGNPGHRLVFALLIVAFTYFYISITFDLNDLTQHFKQAGFFVRGIKPGKSTADYIGAIMSRITFVGAIFLAIISILPETFAASFGLAGKGAVLLGGTGLLIVVGVLLDVIQKVGTFLLAHKYGGAALAGALGAGARKTGKRF
ncbi:MAG: preprotein translocase subunit SecY [Planctomycetota bacterium]|nr:preprotein translocase subunit SecY [Planctomycetota bacterium]MDW8372271.1 preprotein translocase subunit SecY [Planctomycetota bacterium]